MEREKAQAEIVNMTQNIYSSNQELFPMDEIEFYFTDSIEYYGQLVHYTHKKEKRYRINLSKYLLEAYMNCDDGEKLIRNTVGHELAHASLYHEIPPEDHHGSDEFQERAEELSGEVTSNLANNSEIRSLDSYAYVAKQIAEQASYHIICEDCKEEGKAYYIDRHKKRRLCENFAFGLISVCRCGNTVKVVETKSKIKPWTWYGSNVVYSEEDEEVNDLNQIMFILLNIISLLKICYNRDEIMSQKNIEEA